VTWHSAELLWLLALVPVLAGLLVHGFRRRRRAELRHFASPQAQLMIAGRSPKLRAARGVLLVIGIGLVAVALARPQYGSRTRMLRKRGVDVVVALDFSKSMLARDVKPSRIDRAKAELTQFIAELGGDRIGIVAFAGETMEFPMTVDYSAAALFFRELGPYDMPVGGTAIGRALVASKRLLERANHGEGKAQEDRARVVVLMTDGEDHEGDPVAAAKELGELGARVFVVGIGSRSGEPVPTYASDGTWTGYMRDEAGNPVVSALTADGEKQLREIASVANGKYIRAGDGGVGMAAIRLEMRRMKQAELEARRITVHEERYAIVLLLGFLLILLEALLPDSMLGRRVGRSAS